MRYVPGYCREIQLYNAIVYAIIQLHTYTIN